MKKNVIIAVVIIAIFAILGIVIYNNNSYSLEQVKELLAEGDKLPENVSIIQTVFDENNKQQGHTDFYIKGNMAYVSQNDNTHIYAETISNGNDNYMISHDTKTIFHKNNTENNSEKNLGISESFFNMLNQNTTYEYCGKATVDNAKCIKVSLCQENENSIDLKYFYIDLEDKRIVKEEGYQGATIKDATLRNSTTYKYTYNTVQDTDIVKFDLDNYEDYTYNEF